MRTIHQLLAITALALVGITAIGCDDPQAKKISIRDHVEASPPRPEPPLVEKDILRYELVFINDSTAAIIKMRLCDDHYYDATGTICSGQTRAAYMAIAYDETYIEAHYTDYLARRPRLSSRTWHTLRQDE